MIDREKDGPLERGAMMKRAQGSWKRTLITICAFVILFSGSLLLAYSRFITGMHTANQVLYGLMLGYWSALTCIFFIDPRVEVWLNKLYADQMSKREMLNGLAVNLIASFVAIFSVTIALLVMVKQGKFTLPPDIVANIESCRGGKPFTREDLIEKNSLLGGIMFLGTGCVCGAIYRKYHAMEFEPRDYATIKMFAVRTLAALIMIIPAGLLCVTVLFTA